MMNHIFRVIWNRTLRLWQCVSEKVKSTTKAGPCALKSASGKPASAIASTAVMISLAGLFSPTAVSAAAQLTFTDQAQFDSWLDGHCAANRDCRGYRYKDNTYGMGRSTFVMPSVELDHLTIAEGATVRTGRIVPKMVGADSHVDVQGTWLVGLTATDPESLFFWNNAEHLTTTVTGKLMVGHASDATGEYYNTETGQLNPELHSYDTPGHASFHLLLGNFTSDRTRNEETFTIKGQGEVAVEHVIAFYNRDNDTFVNDDKRYPNGRENDLNNHTRTTRSQVYGSTYTFNIEDQGKLTASGFKFGSSAFNDNQYATVTINQTGENSQVNITNARGIEKGASATTPLAVHLNFQKGTLHIAQGPGDYFGPGRTKSTVLFKNFDTITGRSQVGADSIVIAANADDKYTFNFDEGITLVQQQKAGFTGQGTWEKTGKGALVLTADNSGFTGTVEVNGGSLVLGGYGYGWNTADNPEDPAKRDTASHSVIVTGGVRLGNSTNLHLGLGGTWKVGKDGTFELSPFGPNLYAYGDTFEVANNVDTAGIFRVFTKGSVQFSGTHTIESTGHLKIEAGKVTVTGKLQGDGALEIGYKYANQIYGGQGAVVILKDQTDYSHVGKVELAKDGDGTLRLDNAKLALGELTHATGTNSATFEMKNNSTLKIEGGTTQPKEIFTGFDTTSRDVISSVGENTLEVTGKARQDANAGFSGSGTLNKAGDGTFIVNAKNDAYTGTWAIKEGVLQWGNNVALSGADAPTFNNGTQPAVKMVSELVDASKDLYKGTFAFGNSDTYTLGTDFFANDSAKQGNMQMAGSGTLVVNANQTYAGQTQIRGGTLSLQGAMTALGSSTKAIDTGVGDEKGVFEIRRNGTDDTFNRLITGTGSFTKAGTGKVTLEGGDQTAGHFYDYKGNTAVRGGELMLASGKMIDSSAGGTGSNILVGSETAGQDATFTIEGTAKVGGKVVLADQAQANTVNTIHVTNEGKMSSNAIVRAHNSPDTATAALRLSGMGMVELTGSGTLFDQFTEHDKIEIGNGGGVIAVTDDHIQTQNKTAKITNVEGSTDGQQHLVKAGSGTLVLTAENDYHGKTIVADGILQLGNGTTDKAADTSLGGRGDIVLGNQGGLRSDLTGDTKGTLAIALAGDATNSDDNYSFDGRKITGQGDLVQKGTNKVVINQAHTYDGDTKVLNGVLSLQDGGQLGTSTGAIITGKLEGAANPGMFEIRTNDDNSLPNGEFNRLITGEGGFIKAGSSTVHLSKGNTTDSYYDYKGDTTVRGGTLVLDSGKRIDGVSDAGTPANIRVGAETGNGSAAFQIKGTAKVGGSVILADNAAANSTNTIEISDYAKLSAGKIERANNTAKAIIRLSGMGTVELTGEGTQTLFEGFKAGDAVELGAGGGVIAVTGNSTQKQLSTMAISDLASTSNNHLVKAGSGTLVLTADNTFSGKLVVADGMLLWGDGVNTTQDRNHLGGTGDIHLGNQNTDLVLPGEYATGETKGVFGVSLAQSETFRLNGTRDIVGHGDFVQAGPNMTEVSTTQGYDGTTYIRGGTLRLMMESTTDLGNAANKTAVNTGGDANGVIPAGSGTFELHNDGTAGDKTWDRLVEGTGNLKKTGDGKVILNATSTTVPDANLTYTGDTIVAGGELVLATGMHITQTANLLVGAATAGENADNRSNATFTIQGSATVKDQVKLGAGAASNSMNTLKLEGSTLNAGDILKVVDGNATNVNVALLMKGGATVKITKTTAEESQTTPVVKDLFTGFNTSDTAEGGDKILIGDGGTTLAIADGLIVKQKDTAAITDDPEDPSGVTNHTHHLTKDDTGTLVLTAKNTYSGAVKVHLGTLQLGDGGSATETKLGGNGNITVDANANFAVNFSDDYHLGGDNTDTTLRDPRLVTGNGNVVQLGAGTMIVDRLHTYKGDTVIKNGTVSLRDGGQLGDPTSQGVVNTGSGVAEGDLPNKGTFEIRQTQDKTFTHLITGAGDFVKAGTGTTTLDNGSTNGEYTYKGDTKVVGGTLVLANDMHITQTANLMVGAEEAGNSETERKTATFKIEGSATVKDKVQLGAGAKSHTMNTLELAASQLDAANIAKVIDNGMTDVKATLLMHDHSTVTITKTEAERNSPSTSPIHKELFAGFDTTETGGDKLLIGNDGTNLNIEEGIIAEQSADAAISNMADGENHDLTKQGAGTLVLAAKNDYSGKLTIAEGKIVLGKDGQTKDDAKLGGTGDIALGTQAANGSVLEIHLTGDDYNFEGNRKLTGVGSLVQSGTATVVLDQAHTYTGDTTILAGKVKLLRDATHEGQAGTGGKIVTGVDNQKGEYIIDQSIESGLYTHAQLITGTGKVTKQGDGTTVLNHGGADFAANDYSFAGPLLVENGVLELAAKNQLSAVSNINVSAKTQNGSATFRLNKGSQVKSDVAFALGDANSAANSLSILDINGATVNVNQITTSHTAANAKVALVIRNTALLNVTEGSTLFEGFATDGDRVYVGKDGGTLNIADGLTVTQNANAALIDWTDASNDGHEAEDSITKSGTGALILNAQNDYSGKLTIDAGTLQLGADGATAHTAKLGGVGDIQMNNQSTLILNVKDATGFTLDDEERDIDGQGHLELDRKITGSGSLIQQGEGTAILLGQNDYSGTTEIKANSRLQVGDKTDAALGGQGTIQNAGRLIYSLDTQNITVDNGRAIVGGGEFEQKGTADNHLTLANTSNVLGDVYVTSGMLTATSLQAINKASFDAHNRLVLGADPATTSTEPAPANRLRLMARRLLAAAPTVSTDPTFEAAFDANTVWERDIVGNGTFLKTGNGLLTFTDGYTYSQSGTTILNGGGFYFMRNVGMPNSKLEVEKGMLAGDINVHNFAGLDVSGSAEDTTVTILMKNSSDYTQFWNTGDVSITGGKLFVDVSHYNADKSENFPGNMIPYVIKADSTHSMAGSLNDGVHKFAAYEDTSVLFNFLPLYDYTSPEEGVHLYVQSASPDAEACRNAGMGKVECIVREYGHDFLANLAKVADKEFADNPMGKVAQYFYSITTNERVDAAAVRGAPLMTGSMNQTLQHDAQNLAAYAPRDPCDPTVTEHGHNLWAKFEQSWDSQEALRGSTGYRGRHSTIAVGKDVCVKDNSLRLGAFVGYTDSSIKSHGNVAMHNAKTDLYQIGLYGDKVTAENRDVDFQVGYGRGRVEGHRNLLLFTADSKYDANILYAGVGYNWRGDIVSPFVRFDYTFVRSDAYEETGAKVFNYNVESEDRHSGIVQAGYRFDIKPEGKPYKFYGRVGVGYELLDKYNTITAAFQGIPNAYFDTRSAEDSRLMGLFDFGMNYKASDRVDFNVNYHLTAKPDYRDHGGQVTMTVHF